MNAPGGGGGGRRDFRTAANKGAGKKGSTGPPAYFLPDDLYESFKVKPGIPFWRPRNLEKQYKTTLGGLGKFVNIPSTEKFEVPKLRFPKEEAREDRMVKQRWELRDMQKERARAEYAERIQRRLGAWDPHAYDERKTPDGYLTLFIGRLASSTTEEQLKSFVESSTGGQVTFLRMIRDLKHPKRSYAFVQFSEEKSLQEAFQKLDGVQFNGTHIVVDVERGRTVRMWIPQKYGGGLGGPPRQKGFTVKQGRGPPEPPSKKRRAERPGQNDRSVRPRMQQ